MDSQPPVSESVSASREDGGPDPLATVTYHPTPVLEPATTPELPPDRPAPLSGTIGPYEILEVIKSGGMGTVYKAWHRTMNRTVALKTLRADYLAEPLMKKRFDVEVRAVAQLNHPNIVPIYEVGEHVGVPYYTME